MPVEEVRVGDELRVTVGQVSRALVVRVLSDRRLIASTSTSRLAAFCSAGGIGG